jgi:hypothetical protein
MLLRALRFRRIDWPLAILMVIAWTVIAVYGAAIAVSYSFLAGWIRRPRDP